jgi:hypothetical protein
MMYISRCSFALQSDTAHPNPILLSRWRRAGLIPRRHAISKSKIHTDRPSISLLTHQQLHRLFRTLDINEIRMRKATRLARPTINRNTHIHDILHAPEQIVEIAIRHLEGHVANEKGLAGWVFGRVISFSATECGAMGADFGGGVVCVLADQATALEELLVQRVDAFGRGFLVGEIDVAESEGVRFGNEGDGGFERK